VEIGFGLGGLDGEGFDDIGLFALLKGLVLLIGTSKGAMKVSLLDLCGFVVVVRFVGFEVEEDWFEGITLTIGSSGAGTKLRLGSVGTELSRVDMDEV
jgi:hypothetical protein